MNSTSHTVRRCIVNVPQSLVLQLLDREWLKHDCVMLPMALDLPKTARVLDVWPDFRSQSFCFVLEDDSFEEVAEGCMLPERRVKFELVRNHWVNPEEK
jgi:hypothetical protein